MKLDDINWRLGTLSISQDKSQRENLLPLPSTLAKALIDYLKKGRPKTNSRFIFVYHRAPYGQPVKPETIRNVMRRAYQRCDLPTNLTGTHILRRTFATRLLCSGTSIKDIADIMRHRSIDTTMFYTKVNLPQLKQVALPWPRS